MKDLISKPVLATLLAAIAIVAGAIWFHYPPAKTETLAPAVTAAPTPAPVAATPPPAPKVAAPIVQDTGGLPAVIPIPLTNIVIEAENGSWVKDKDYVIAPHQPHEFGGVLFLMDGMLQLQGKLSRDWKKRSYREDIDLPLALTNITEAGTEIVQRGTNIGSVYLLGATRYGSAELEPIVNLIWHYTDGSTLRTPIENQNHFRDWVRIPYEEPAHLPYLHSKVVWTAPQPSNPGQNVRLYRTALANPAPAKVISDLEFSSAMADPTLFIVGVTLDPLIPGMRPDASPDLEPTDATPPKKIQIFVLNSSGQAVPQAKLEVSSEVRNGSKRNHTTNHLITDASGSLEVNYPPDNLGLLSISASQDDYGSRKMVWNLDSGDTVPDSYTIKLAPTVSIGGLVLTAAGAPIPDASISVYRYWTGASDPNQKGDQPDFGNKDTTTDTDGKWQVKGVPQELLDHIGFNVKHPAYLSTNITLTANGNMVEQLRAGTFTITLNQGQQVTGRVLDDSDNPIAGATVTAGQRWSNDRRTVKTDDEGHFAMTNVPTGDLLFTASAEGRAPQDQSYMVKPDMAEIVFKLGAGKTIKGVVDDDKGAPIAGVRVQLPNYGAESGYDFSTNTDANGRFEWNSAPDEQLSFDFSKQGYEHKQNVSLKTDQDNTVVMHDPRQIQGQVLDADSGQPVTAFSVQSGQQNQWGDTNTLYGGINHQDFKSQDGTFTLSLTEESDNAIEVTSDNYAPQTAHIPDAQNGAIQMTVKLTGSPALQGTVTLPDGTPAPGVTVAITLPGQTGANWVQFHDNRFQSSYGNGQAVVTTDASGQFSLGSPPTSGGSVAAAGDAGFVEETIDQFRANPTLVLQPYGRIEGTLTIGGQPGAGVDLYFNKLAEGISTDFNAFKVTTDAQGQFTMENVPPGEGAIVRLVQMMPNSWTHSDSTTVEVKPGETTQVTLGGNGAVIRGTVYFDNPPTNGQSVLYQGNLSQKPDQSLNSPAETQAYYSSAAGRALKHYVFIVNPDGTFTTDDVTPGNYSLSIEVMKNTSQPWSHQIATGGTSVTVPDSFDPATPIDVGQVELKAVNQP